MTSLEPAELGDWYHRIGLDDGRVTPGTRNQSLVFDLYRPFLPDDLTDLEVLDLGANAGGVSVEFAKRGAKVLAVEIGETYLRQAQYVIDTLSLDDRIELRRGDVYGCLDLGRRFDVVCYMGLSYHLRHPQLALDMLTHLCRGTLLASTQTLPQEGLVTMNRARHVRNREQGVLFGWEPTEGLFLDMLAHAGFQTPKLVSTAPHPGESPGNICGNRSYFFAWAANKPHLLPFVDSSFVGKPRRQQ